MDSGVIENLAALQEIDRRHRDLQSELAEIEREVAEQLQLLDEKRRQAEMVRSEAETLATRRRDLEGQLQLEEQKIKDRRMRLGRLRNDKEVAALQREIDLTKEANARLEEEVLALIEQAEALEGNLREVEAELEKLDEASRNAEANGDGRARQLRTELESHRAEREAIAGRLGEGVRRKYEQIFARRGGIAVVEARDGSCTGCNMIIRPQLYIEIQRARDVKECPNCHRILVWRPAPGEGQGSD